MSGTACYWTRLSLVTLSYYLVLVYSAPADRLGERTFIDGLKEEDRKFVSDPSAQSDVFQKEGDMTFILGRNPFIDGGKEHNKRERKNAVVDPTNLWPGATIPYEISSVFNEGERFVVLSAMRHWEENTCIRFRPKRSSDDYYVLVMSGQERVCQSFVGRIHVAFQPQGLTLGPGGCVKFATVLHELGHAIGFYHEHNRPDRDEHIEINFDNVVVGAEFSFNKIPSGDTNLLGYGYDFASVMHYDKDFFSWNGEDTILAKKEGIPFGGAEELSPLDIAKANALYRCGSSTSWPPLSTSIPTKPTPTLPPGSTCGQVISGRKNGTLTSPGYPSYRHNLDCAYVIIVPKGYYVRLQLPNLAIEESTGCSKDYVQFYYGNSLNSADLVRYSGYVEGRLCNAQDGRFLYSLFSQTVTVFFHTDGSGSGSRGLQISFTALDENECEQGNLCHGCTNLVGGFECRCNSGYYHSAAAETCYDVNECAYDNGGCEHQCINSGGSYSCECRSGYYLQSDGKSCATTPPAPQPTSCGSNFTTATGTLQTPNWPQTYPNDIDCEWFIRLPNASKVVEITCEVELPGTQPGCTKDSITLYDGHSLQSTSHGPYCGSVASGIIRMSSNFAKIVFHAGTEHNSIHKGAQCTFRSVDAPTPPPPTTPPPSQCGGKLNTASGSFQSPNWPETYPIDIDCEWIIELPDSSKRVEIRCEENPFGIAGSFPSCTKDHLKIYDGHSTQDTLTGTYCHFTRPRAMTMSTNLAMAVFHAGPAHSPTRRGFRCTFQSVTPPTRPPRSTTPPPATPPPTPASQCGGTLTAASGSIESPNWPETYPVDVDCVWTIELPDPSKRIELTFEAGFGLAGRLPSCTKDHLHVHDENTGTVYGPFCHYAIPNVPVMSSNRARLVLHAGPAHNPSRQGFKANYVSV